MAIALVRLQPLHGQCQEYKYTSRNVRHRLLVRHSSINSHLGLLAFHQAPQIDSEENCCTRSSRGNLIYEQLFSWLASKVRVADARDGFGSLTGPARCPK